MGQNNTNPPTQGATNLLGAIGTNEGYGAGNNVPTLSNNPGSITSSNPNGVGFGVANSAGVINYGSIQDGTAAAYALINSYVQNNPSITIAQFAQKWTQGPNGPVATSAINNYASSLGVPSNTKVADILSGAVATKSTSLNFVNSQPPGQKVALPNTGSQAPALAGVPTGVAPTASAYSPLSNNSSNVDLSQLVSPIVITEGLDATPWFQDPGLLTGNPRLRQEVQPVTFQVFLHENTDFILSTGGKTGAPIQVELNASMKSINWSMKHLYHHQRTRTAHHITMWGMQADTIEGQCTTGIFMNQFGLTDYYSTRTVNDKLKNLVTSGEMFVNGNTANLQPLTTTDGIGGTTPLNTNVFNGPTVNVTGPDGQSISTVGGNTSNTNGFVNSGNQTFQNIMNNASQSNPNFSQTNAFRVAAQDAFMEFLALFKMNGSVWFWNKLYQDNVGETRDWTQVEAWSPILGLSSAQKNARNNDVLTRGGVVMSYRNFVFQGYFKTLQWTMDARNPFKWDFSFVFQVERTIGQQFLPDK